MLPYNLSFIASYIDPAEDSGTISVLVWAASVRRGPRDYTEGVFCFIKVDWRKVATKRFSQPRDGRPCPGRSGPWSPARVDTRVDSPHSCRCQSSRCMIHSMTAAKSAPWVPKWVGSSAGDDRKELEGLLWLLSKCSIKGKPREHYNFLCILRSTGIIQ